VKPDFWTDEKVVELSSWARLLFIGLWNFADDEGRMVLSPKRIKMQIFPADNLDISELFGELRRNSMITIYSVENIEYLQVNNFQKHQKIDKRTASKHPPCPPNPAELPRIPPTDSIKEGIKEGNGRETTTASNEKISFSAQEGWKGINGYLAIWKEAYPAINIENALAQARAWLIANPNNKKKNYARFLTNWFSREQDRAPRVNINSTKPGKMARAAEALRKSHGTAADSATANDRGTGVVSHAGTPARLRANRR
jgi:hypothetical protein